MLHYYEWVVGKCDFDTWTLLNFKLRKKWENLKGLRLLSPWDTLPC